VIYGRLNYGTFGEEINITDTSNFTEEIIEGKKALLKPFYFLFYLPKKEKGILILERKGNDAIKGPLDEWLLSEIFNENKYLHKYRSIIKGFLPIEVWEKWIKPENIMSFDFEEVTGLKNKEDYLSKEFEGIEGTANVSIAPDKSLKDKALDKTLRKIRDILGLTPTKEGYIEFDEKIVKNFKFKALVKGKPRTFYLGGGSYYPYMDMDIRDSYFKGGHAKFEKIHELGKEHAKDLFGLIKER